MSRKPKPPKLVWDIKTPTVAITKTIGREKIVELQKANVFLDWFIPAVTWTAFVVLWWALANTRSIWLWIPGAMLQAVVVMCGFYVIRHDQFFHRRIAGARGSYVIGVITSQVMLQPYTEHTLHGDHHVHVGWDLSEEFFSDLDRRWKRWLCLTAPGIILMLTRALRPKDAPQPNKGWLPSPGYMRRLRRERRLLILSVIGLCVAGYYHPHGVLFGYVLPIVLFGPFVIMTRVVFQHGETDPANPFHVTVLYRTGFISRVLFYWSLGDGHLAHHFYPLIPLYKLGKAADMFLPVLRAHGVPERSLWQVLKGFFIDGYEIRSRWLLPGEVPAAPIAARASSPSDPRFAKDEAPSGRRPLSTPMASPAPAVAAAPAAPDSAPLPSLRDSIPDSMTIPTQSGTFPDEAPSMVLPVVFSGRDSGETDVPPEHALAPDPAARRRVGS